LYDNLSIKNKILKKEKFKKDRFECELQSYRLVPPSYTRTYYNTPSQNNHTGTFKIRNPYTGVTSNGSYTTKSTNSYMTGYNNAINRYQKGRENARISRMYSLRRQAYHMCLKKRGWRRIK